MTTIHTTTLKCSPIRDIAITKDGEVSEKRSVKLSNSEFAITISGDIDKLPFFEGHSYTADFFTPQTLLGEEKEDEEKEGIEE